MTDQKPIRITLVVAVFVLVFVGLSFAQVSRNNADSYTLDQTQASHFASLALKCVNKEYPNYIQHQLESDADVLPPRSLHPAFYGCFDWHSSVHGHWLLAHLLRLFPSLPEAGQIRQALNADLTVDNVNAEVKYFDNADRKSFERPYGWAWLLKLHEELYLWNDPDAKRWFAAIQPLADTMVARYIGFFPKQTYPVRVGTHFNTAFGLSFACDYAVSVKSSDPKTQSSLDELKRVVIETGRRYFAKDAGYPGWIEPNGDDFLSSSLIEADLMRRIMPAAEFANWFARFLPGVASGKQSNILKPATVSDRSDPKIVHLDGLNLSRAWCMREIASALPPGSPTRRILAASAALHAEDALKNVASGNYEGEHWLATFAVYMLSTRDPQ
jgi:hypothetical protein